jgi:ABC-type branched-subunit amino acid transport system permease subunit
MMGPVLGAGFIKYCENIFSKINDSVLHDWFGWLPPGVQDFVIGLIHPFVGDGWNLTLGLLFVLVVVFLPGGIVQGAGLVRDLFGRGGNDGATNQPEAAKPQAAE